MAEDTPNDDSSYPLNCIDDTGDGFSGWFAISNPRQCNDFCYWQLPSQNISYAAWNTANPHKFTAISTPLGMAYWTCAYDSADDKTVASSAEEHRWVDSWWRYYSPNDYPSVDNVPNVPFPYLKCQKGAGELLKTWPDDAVKSAVFWECLILLALLIFIGEVAVFYSFCKRRGSTTQYEHVSLENGGVLESQADFDMTQTAILHIDKGNDDAEEFSFLHTAVSLTATYFPRCKSCAYFASLRSLLTLRILLVILLNGLIACTLSFLAICLIEIKARPSYSERMQKLTPACSDPTVVCPAGNRDINKQSSHWLPLENVQGRADDSIQPFLAMSNTMRPFSYIIASDAQLYWFNGEWAEMGRKSVPSSCSPSDSCARCTGNHGKSTNLRLKKAWEGMMSGKYDGLNATNGSLPIPNTLVMNGDLTAYFHPWEKKAYDIIYNNIDGLKYYFPSLGNHDIEHASGAMFGGDEWLGGLPNCNMEHAIGFMKSGFCGQIPAFGADRIVRYDSSSLAYSWDEGRYHFVHSHYYPSYEMASVNYRSSLEWLDRDLQLAHDAGLTTVLFVHAAEGLNEAMETILLGKNVRAIIAGHTHRCLLRKCEGVYPLHKAQVKGMNPQELADAKCIPAAYDTCQVLFGENMIYLKDKDPDVPLPTKRLENIVRKDKPLCPKPAPFFINETDNTLLCRRIVYSQPNFPFGSDHNSGESIPIFWSGSSSFETFLRGDFYEDHFIINAMTVALERGEAARYVDLHEVPNAVYPYHNRADIEEVVIHI